MAIDYNGTSVLEVEDALKRVEIFGRFVGKCEVIQE